MYQQQPIMVLTEYFNLKAVFKGYLSISKLLKWQNLNLHLPLIPACTQEKILNKKKK